MVDSLRSTSRCQLAAAQRWSLQRLWARLDGKSQTHSISSQGRGGFIEIFLALDNRGSGGGRSLETEDGMSARGSHGSLKEERKVLSNMRLMVMSTWLCDSMAARLIRMWSIIVSKAGSTMLTCRKNLLLMRRGLYGDSRGIL